MLGKRVYTGNQEVVPNGWACETTDNLLCKCSKSSAKSSSQSYRGIPCRILQWKGLLHTDNTLKIGCRNESFWSSGIPSHLIGAVARQDQHI